MTAKEKAATTQILTACLRGFPNSKADGETIKFYVAALNDLTFEQVLAALSKLCKTAKFFPTVAEIYEAAESITNTAQNTGVLEPGAAWEEAMRNVRENHVYKPWVFSTPEVEQAVKQFGKMELVQLEESGVNTARAQFMRIYEGCVRRSKEKKQNEDVLKKLGIEKIKTIGEIKKLEA
jgi:hypothetical protein